MDDGKVDLDPDLTSSIGDVLLSSKNDKTDANDSTPTSSTDAASSFSGASLNVSEDPISSTSSDLMEKDKLPGTKSEINKNDAEVSKNLLGTDGDVDLLDMNIADVSSEPINEDVEDIVQDLENLLGEPEPQHDFPTRRKDKSPSKEKELIASLDVALEEKSDFNLLPETSHKDSSEKDETDNSIPPVRDIDQIIIAEQSVNVVECSINENDTFTVTQETVDITPQEKSECVEKPEKTEDISCKSEKLHVATAGKSEELAENVTIQNEATCELVENIPDVKEINEVNTVSSSEATVDQEDRQEESSHALELSIVSSNEVKDVDVEEGGNLSRPSEVIIEDQDSNIPLETKDKELVTHGTNAITSCNIELNKSCEVSEPKEEHSPPTGQASEEDQDVEVKEILAGSEEQSLVVELKNQVSASGEQCSVTELENEVPSPEEQLSVTELVNQTPEAVITEVVVGSTNSSAPTETIHEELQQSFVVDPIQDPSELTDLDSKGPSDSEDIKTEAVPVMNETVDIFESTPTEAVIEPVDDGSEVKNVPDETEASTVDAEVEIDRNVTSSSDLSNNQDSDAKEPIILDDNTTENLEDNNETNSDVPKEINESEEPVLVEAEESVLSISEYQNVEFVEETISTNEILCEGIVEEVESPSPEISTEDQVIEMDVVPSAEETVVITDITTSEENSMQDKDVPGETVSSKDEEIPDETISSDDSTKSEVHTAKLEDINDIVTEGNPATILADTIMEETKNEEIPEETISSDDSSKSEDHSTKLEDITDTVTEETSETILEDTIIEQTNNEEIPEKTISSDDSSKSEGHSTKLEDITDTVIEEKSATVLENTIIEHTSIIDSMLLVEEPSEIIEQENELTTNEEEIIELESQQDRSQEIRDDNISSPSVENVLEEQIVESEEATTLENAETVHDEAQNIKLSSAESPKTDTEEEPSNTKAGVDKNQVEVLDEMELNTVEDIIAEPTEECKKIEESPTKGNIPLIEEAQTPSDEALDQGETIEEIISPEHSEEMDDNVVESIPAVSEETEELNVSVGENKVEEEIVECIGQNSVEVLQENLDQEIAEEVSCSDTTPTESGKFETQNEETNMEPQEGDSKITFEEFSSKAEGKETLDSPKESASLESKTLDFDITFGESCAITNEDTTKAEMEKDIESVELSGDKVIHSLESNQEELIPVNEEICVKKVIVYEHKCGSHNTNDSIITSEEGKQEESDTLTATMEEETSSQNRDDATSIEIVELVEKGAESEDDTIKTEEIIPDIDKCMQDFSTPVQQEQKVDEQKELSIIPQVSDKTNIEEADENMAFEQGDEGSVKEPDVSEENISQREEVSSSSQHDNQVKRITTDSADLDDLKVVGQSSSEILLKTSEELLLGKTSEEGQVDSNTEQTMEDQTTAAVQSILNNMLTEERNIERIIEKEDPPLVHSSYSSYEVQKAVQELQGITVEPVEISSEVIECISSSEKQCESEKAEFDDEKCAVTNTTSQSEIEEAQVFESKESEGSQDVDIPGPIPSEQLFDEKVECVQEIVDSPSNNSENQDTITQSNYEPSQDDNEDVQSPEDPQSLLPSVEKCSTGTSHIDEPVVVPSIDLSEESSSEDDSDQDKKENVISSSVTSTSVNEEPHSDTEDKESKMVPVKHVLKAEKASGVMKNDPKKHSPRETRHSSRISERMKPHNLKEDINQPLSVNIEEIERDKPYSPKITIKPIKEDEPNEDKEEHKGSLKITITKQSDNTHSILKMCSPEVEHRQKQSEHEEQNVVPKLVIKTSDTHSDQHSPKMSTRSSKQVLPNSSIRSGSPRITIKPIVKPDSKETVTSPLKITIKPIGKPEEFSRQQQRHSPKQMKNKADDDHYSTRSKMTKSSENSDVHSPKVTIKPVKPPEEAEVVSTPKITIKPIEKPEEARVSPKITIKPVLRLETEMEDEVKARIVLKINKGNLPAKDTERIGRESRKRELEEDKSEKLAKIKLKFSKDGDAHIVHKKVTEMQSSNKRQQDFETERSKRFRAEVVANDSDDDVKLVENHPSPIVISEDSQSQDSVILIEEARDPLAEYAPPEPKPQVTPVVVPRKRGRPRKVPLVVREEFGNEQREKIIQATSSSPVPVSSTIQPIETETTGRPKRSCRAQSVRDTLGIKPRKPSKPRGGKRGGGAKSISMKPDKEPVFSEEKISAIKKSLLTEDALQDARSSGILKISETLSKKLETKKEEPIKSLGLKSLLEAAKDQNIIEVIEIDTPSNSPKCLEPVEIDKIEEEIVVEEKSLEKISNKEKEIISTSESIIEIKDFEIQKDVLDDGDCNKESSDFGGTDAAASDVEMQPPTPVFAPPLSEASAVDISSTTDIAMFEEETRMSADVSSRAQTPAKQVVSADVVVEESQSSIQSTATTESGKISRRSRLEVHQDQDGSVFTADQLNEYYWGGNGPFMIQEQVAQYLGIKSFKRKYPGIPRRMVDMQERDYIRENGLASESMCDLGLTAVNSADILDIMYTDFQEKYEEFCRFQRDKQAKDLLNKQKALSMSANQEKSKLDILEQAVQSAATYNANFNKTRREQRRACMDLQTMNIHYPKGKLKKINMPKIGNYPVAVVPGQFTDYYKEFTPTEINNLPLNTMLYTELHKILPEISDSDSDSSGSDSDDSSSSGSDSNSSCEDNCKMCDKGSVTPRKSPVNSSV